jgi:hypothetical protein
MDSLTMADRGDCCPAQARVVMAKGDYRILMCHHHYGKHAESLLTDGWEIIIDDRDQLVAKTGAEVR